MKMLALATIGLMGLTGCVESETKMDSSADASQNVGERLTSEDVVSLRGVGRWTETAYLNQTKVTSDGRFMVFRTDAGGVRNLFAYDLDSGTTRMLNRPNRGPGGWLNRQSESLLLHDGVTNFEIVPGEHRVIYSSDEERSGRYLLYQVNIDGGQPAVLSPSRAGESDEPAYYGVDRDFKMAPNGKFVVFKYHSISTLRYRPDLYLADLDTSVHIRINPEDTFVVNGDQVSPESSHVAFQIKNFSSDLQALSPYRLLSYKIETGSVHELVPNDMQDPYRSGYYFKFSPNGEFVAYKGQASSAELGDQLFLVDIEGRKRPQKLNHQLPMLGWIEPRFQFSSDSKKILYVATDRVINYNLNAAEVSHYVVDIAAPGKSRHVAKEYGVSPARGAQFSPSGQKIMYETSVSSPVQLAKNFVFQRDLSKLHIIDSNTGVLKASYLTSLDGGFDTSSVFLGEDRVLTTGPKIDPRKSIELGYGAVLFDIGKKVVVGELARPSGYGRRYIVKGNVVLQFYGQAPDVHNQIGSLTAFSNVDGSHQDLVSLSDDLGAVLYADSNQSRLYFHSGLNGRSTLNVIESK